MFDYNMLEVDFRNGVSREGTVVEGRKYTLTHNDNTGELFLTVALAYAYDKINFYSRDEVFGQWKRVNNKFVLKIYVYVDGNKGIEEAKKRNEIFRKELNLALSAIIYGDKYFINKNKDLLKSEIIVRFISIYEEFNVSENYGLVEKYYKNRDEVNKDEVYEEESILDDRDPLINEVILTLLNQKIKEEILKVYKNDINYCLKEAEVLEIYKYSQDNYCEAEYKVYVGLKVGEVKPDYNNFIIGFLITPKEVKTLSVKNPR